MMGSSFSQVRYLHKTKNLLTNSKVVIKMYWILFLPLITGTSIKIRYDVK